MTARGSRSISGCPACKASFVSSPMSHSTDRRRESAQSLAKRHGLA